MTLFLILGKHQKIPTLDADGSVIYNTVKHTDDIKLNRLQNNHYFQQLDYLAI